MKKINCFFFSFLIGLVLVFAGFVALVNFCGRGVTDQPWYLDLYPLKEHFAKMKKSPKIIIIGGSSSLMGIDGEKLQQYTGMDNINLSLSIMMPMRFYLVELDKYVQKGDVVVMPLEFSKHYNETDEKLFTQFGISLLFGCDPAAQKTLKFTELCSLYFQYGFSWVNSSLFHPQGPMGRLTGTEKEKKDAFDCVYRESYVVSKWEKGHVRDRYNAPDYHYDLSPYGDWLVEHDPVPLIPAGGRLPQEVTEEFVYSYNQIKKLVESRGAKLLLVYPNRYSYVEEIGIDEFTALLRSRGITIYGRPESVAFPKHLYYEPLFHMNKEGAELWTYELAKTICKETGRPMPRIADWPYVVFADDSASCFPGVASARLYESGVEIAQKEFPLVVNIPQTMRGRKLELSLITKPSAGQSCAIESVRVGDRELVMQDFMHQERAESIIHVPSEYTAGEKLNLTCVAGGEKIGMERVFIRIDVQDFFPVTKSAQSFRFAGGFAAPESWGRWTDGECAEFSFHVPAQFRNKSLTLTWDVLAFVHPANPACRFVIEAGRKKVFETETRDFNNKITFFLTAADTAKEWIDFTIKIDHPVSPKECGVSEDPRRLGVGLESISIVETVAPAKE